MEIFSWNVAFLPLGLAENWTAFSPWPERVEKVGAVILKADADLVLLQEVYDDDAARELIRRLEGRYAYFYYSIGSSRIGEKSGLFVASKFPLKNARFTLYKAKKNNLESFFVGKGFFDFELFVGETKAMHVFVTHLQHSENDLAPVVLDQKLRQKQLSQLFLAVKDETAPVLIAGDLNMAPEECRAAFKTQKNFQNFLLSRTETPKTAVIQVEKATAEVTLDYVFFKPGRLKAFLLTRVLASDGLSDHRPLKSSLNFSF
ncbi:MAG: endonuclease/exonuclease/phosphatase family protein [Parachlamydiales bacterium]